MIRRERNMNLHGSIADLQKSAIQLYLKLQQRFKDNVLIRELWSSMADDLSQQKSSLKALPPSFWNQLHKEHNELLQAVVTYARLQVTDNIKDLPLKSCIEGALQFEEPTILKIYIPIIRSLRENLTNPALDFYIMVKAHLARIARMTASFSGDPIIIQRSSLLLQTFEREVQEPQVEVVIPQKKARAKSAVKPKTAKKAAKPKKAVAKKAAAAKTAAAAKKAVKANKPAKPKKAAAKTAAAAKKAAKPKKAVTKKAAAAKKAVKAKKPAKPKKAAAKTAATAKRAAAKRAAVKRAAGRSSTLAKRAKSRHHRTKPLAKNIQRRRARARR